MAVICEVSDHWWETTDNQWRKSKLPGFFFETTVIYGLGKINVHHLVSSSEDLPQEIISNFLVLFLFQTHNMSKVYWMDRLYQKCIPKEHKNPFRAFCVHPEEVDVGWPCIGYGQDFFVSFFPFDGGQCRLADRSTKYETVDDSYCQHICMECGFCVVLLEI